MTLNQEDIDVEGNLFISNTNEISLKSFEQVLNNIENDMNEWLKKFSWSKDVLFEKHKESDVKNNTEARGEILNCPYNKSHTGILKKNYDKHVLKCNLKMQHHQNEDITEYKKQAVAPSDFQLTLDQKTHQNLLGNDLNQNRCDYTNLASNDKSLVSLTNNHFFINHTPQERLMIYNYSLEQFKNSGYPVDSNWNNETFLNYDSEFKSDPSTKNRDGKSYNDILIELKDKKRRPKSYKTSKAKPFTEVLRDLIGTQMNLLEQLNEFKVEKNVNENNKRSRSSDSSMSVDDDSTIIHHKKKKSYKKKNKKSKKSRKQSTN